MVLAFPSDDFGKEEPDGNDAIKQFAAEKYKVTFPDVRENLPGRRTYGAALSVPDRQASQSQHRRTRFAGTSRSFWWTVKARWCERFEPDMTPDSPELAAAIEKALRGEKDEARQHDADSAPLG